MNLRMWIKHVIKQIDEFKFNELYFVVGCTAEEFISKPKSRHGSNSEMTQSKYDLLREHIAKNLGIPVPNVDIFTVRNHPTLPRTIDVRYSAHGSPFYQPVKLNGRMSKDKNEVSNNALLVLLFFVFFFIV